MNDNKPQKPTIREWIAIAVICIFTLGLFSYCYYMGYKDGKEDNKATTYKLHLYLKKCDCSVDKIVNGVTFKADSIITYKQTGKSDGGIFKFYNTRDIDSISYQQQP